MAGNDRWALPPAEKIYEAFSAIADVRVKVFDGYALVSSSDYKKEYTVRWEDETYSSDDNASYWQGYTGYPLIAVLMLQGRLTYSRTTAEIFKGINWKALNTEYKNRYSEAADAVLGRLSSENRDSIKREANSILEQIMQLDIKRRRGSPRKN